MSSHLAGQSRFELAADSISRHFRWGQTYILESLMYYVPDEHEEAELMAEQISVRLQHSNSAVVLATVKVILYLMNYMSNERLVDDLCRRLSPPLGTLLLSSLSGPSQS